MTAATSEGIQYLTLAYFGRPADPSSLSAWPQTGQSLEQIVEIYVSTAEYQTNTVTPNSTANAVGGQTINNSNLIQTFYNRLFGRNAAQVEIDGWNNAIVSGNVNYDYLGITILNAGLNLTGTAGEAMKAVLTAKFNSSQAYTAVLQGDSALSLAYSTADAIASGIEFCSGITTTTAATPTEASTSVTEMAANSSANGQSYILTSTVDNLTGTTGNDTFTGILDGTTADNTTYSAGDTINGAAGTDKMNITLQGAATADIPAATLTSIEEIYVRNVSLGATAYDVSNASGAVTLRADRSTSDVTFSNIGAGSTIGIIGNGNAVANLTADYDSLAASVDLQLSGAVRDSNVTVATAQTATSAAITSSGTSATTNNLGVVNFGSATLLTAVSIDAAAGFLSTDLGNASNDFAASATITASGAAANQAASSTAAARGAVSIGTLDTNVATVTASGLTAGGIDLTLSAVTQTVTGGVGNNSITTGGVLTTGSVAAGAGTADRLIVAATADLASTDLGAKYTNFEVIQVANAQTVDLDNISGITSVEMNDAGGTTVLSDLSATQAAAVTIVAATQEFTIGVKDATTVGTNDTLNLTYNDGDTTGSETIDTNSTPTIAGVETINITATDDVNISDASGITGMTALTVTGDGDVSITTAGMALQVNTSFNFSALTSGSTFNAAAATGNAFAYTGSAVVDAVTDNVIGGNAITLGAGNDTLTLTDKTGGTQTTNVTGGAGADTITVAMTGNVARDAMKFNFAAGDSVSDSSTTGINATLTDTITGMSGTTLSPTAGTSAEFDTEVAATAVTVGSTDVSLGTTTVANAGDFFINIDNATTTYIYQDTDGDKIIEAGEFAVALTGIATNTLVAGDFAIATGDLILATT